MISKPIYAVIPAHNEEETVGEVVKGLKQLDLDLKIIVVDDGSNDKTAKRAREAGATVVMHLVNLGQWAALRTAFIISLLNHAEVVVSLDGDGQHLPKDLPPLIQPILKNEADFVIGSRFINESKPLMHPHRYFGIKFFNKLINLITGLNLTDCTCGYRAYRADLVAKLLSRINENQYGSLEAIIQASRLKARICETPIISFPSKKTTKGNLRYAYNLLRSIFKFMFV
jgi:glycosyltransferase involved in cell wall biosynthesis